MTQRPHWTVRAERVNRAVGRAAAWLAPFMILVGAYNAVARYLGR